MNQTVTEPSEGKSGTPAEERNWLTCCDAKGRLMVIGVKGGVRATKDQYSSLSF